MLLVDERVGSREFAAPLQKRGLPAVWAHLDFGDFAFEGKGASGTVPVGIEFKKISELVQALRSNRLVGHQLPGMRAMYEFRYLMVEGIWRADKGGGLVELKGKRWVPIHGRMSAMELEERLCTLELKGGLNVRFTNTRADSLRAIAALYRWFSDRDWDSHSSHIALYQATTLVPISDFRRTVASFPGIGIKTSLAVEQHFAGSFRRLILASEAEWAGIVLKGQDGKTRKLGPKDAKRIVEYLK